jgi:hypothetical protein
MDKIRSTRGHGRVGSVPCFSRFRDPTFVSACHAAGAYGLEPARIDQPAGPGSQGVLRGDAVGQEQMPPQELGLISGESSISTAGKESSCDETLPPNVQIYPHTAHNLALSNYKAHNFPVFCRKSFGPEIARVLMCQASFMCQTSRVVGSSIDGTHAQRLGRTSRFRIKPLRHIS